MYVLYVWNADDSYEMRRVAGHYKHERHAEFALMALPDGMSGAIEAL